MAFSLQAMSSREPGVHRPEGHLVCGWAQGSHWCRVGACPLRQRSDR